MAGAFSALNSFASQGQLLEIFTKGEGAQSTRIEGTIKSICEDGLIIESSTGTEYIPSSEILKWKILNFSADNGHQTLTDKITEKPEKKAYSNSADPVDIELLFSGIPNLERPEPCFDAKIIDEDYKKEIDRWSNRYQYAKKVCEPARMAQEVQSVSELAENILSGELFFLAGFFAEIGGLGLQRAKHYYTKGLELEDHSSAIALALLHIQENKWEQAAKVLIRTVLKIKNGNTAGIIRALGQCIMKLDNKMIEGLGTILTMELDDQALNIARRLIALISKDDQQAYKAAMEGNIDTLQKTKLGSALFTELNMEPSELMQKKKTLIKEKPEIKQEIIRDGHISTYFNIRNFGFIVEKSTGQTWFFHKKSVESENLLVELIRGNVRQEVKFKGNPDSGSGKYPTATNIVMHIENNVLGDIVAKRAPLSVRLSGIPRDGSSYAKAKEAEQLNQLEIAYNYFYDEINMKGQHYRSAIKDLAALVNRMEKPNEAIDILDKYRHEYDNAEQSSLDQMMVGFLVKASRYKDAAILLSKIAKKTTIKTKRIDYLRQEAYCYYAAGQFKTAIDKLEALPQDNSTAYLLQKVRKALEDGISTDVPDGLYEEGSLSTLAKGLSAIARSHLEKCEFKGTDERSREKGSFGKRDYEQVRTLLSTIKGRRPRDRAQYLLSLAALCEKIPDIDRNTQMHTYLMWYFSALAEAAMSEDLEIDVIRCYCIESLQFHSTHPRKNIENAWILLLGTYLSSKIGANTLLDKNRENHGAFIFKIFTENSNDWMCFKKHAPYYKHTIPIAYNELENYFKKYGLDFDLEKSLDEEKNRSRYIENKLRGIMSIEFSIDFFRRANEHLMACINRMLFDLDITRFNNIISIFRQCAEYLQDFDFREIEAKYLRLEAEISRNIDEIEKLPTILSYEKILPCLEMLLSLLKDNYNQIIDSTPELEVRNVLDNDFYVVNNEYVSLRILLESKKENSPPIEAISLSIENGKSEPCHSPDPLYGGQRREIELLITPTKKQITDQAFSVNIIVDYRTKKGNNEKLGPFPVAVRLGKAGSFKEITNPYSRYAGGSPIDDDNMFYGRAEIINKVINCISSGSLGQCFVIYGQKRSGKSSVLNQIEKKINDSLLFLKLSAGNFSPDNLLASFARLLIQEMKFALEDRNAKIPDEWPKSSEIATNPVEHIREACYLIANMRYRIVVAIDEFTYIYENELDRVYYFMRAWKALLESQKFNAILVGQDTMPRFIQKYPNEFGFIHDVRLTYLNEEEAYNLATKPILLDGKSRFRGKALQKLFFLTAGNPFFLQITCDRLVRHLNSLRAEFVTEADIDQVVRSMTLGAESLPPERFDALVSAAGESMDIVPRNDLWKLLSRIARESIQTGWCYRNILENMTNVEIAIKDLMDRKILLADGERLKIHVELFTKWLQANQQ